MSRPGNTSSRWRREFGVDRHHVFEVAVDGAVFHHQDLAVALDDFGLDLADFFVHQHFVRQFAVENLLADFRHALGAERVSGARPAQRRLGLFVGLQQRLLRPFRRRRWVLLDLIQAVEHHPRAFGGDGDCFLHVLHWLVHAFSLSCAGMPRQVHALPRIPELKSGTCTCPVLVRASPEERRLASSA